MRPASTKAALTRRLRAIAPELPEAIPRKGNACSRGLGLLLLKILGWRVTGQFPTHAKVIVAVGPHTSNWDFVIGVAGILAVGIDVRYLMKKEAFIWPLSKLFVWLGGVPLDRSSTADTVEQLVTHFNHAEKLWVAIAPEGTRKKVSNWKTGFLRVAKQANIPILLVAWDYPSKQFIVDRLWSPSGDDCADAEAIREYMRGRFVGRHPENQ